MPGIEVPSFVVAAAPLDPMVQEQLLEAHDFSEYYLAMRVDWHQRQIERHMGQVGLALVAGPSDFASPVEKFEHSSALVIDLIHKLGPTNLLQDREGRDPRLEFAYMMYLLRRDFAALPPEEQHPSRMLPEAWLYLMLTRLGSDNRGLGADDYLGRPVFRPDEPELPDDLLALADPDYWAESLVERSSTTATKFRDIYRDPTAPRDMRLEAECRTIDATILGLRLMAETANHADRQRLFQRIHRLNTDFLLKLIDVWKEPVPRGIPNGQLHETTVVARARDNTIKDNEIDLVTSLAPPHVDRVHTDMRPLKSVTGKIVSLMIDVLVERFDDGTLVRAYQAKAMGPEEYEAYMAWRGRMLARSVYLPERIDMWYKDQR